MFTGTRLGRRMASELARLRSVEEGFASTVSAVFGGGNVVLTVRHGGGKAMGFQRGKEEAVGETLKRVGKKLEVMLLGVAEKKKNSGGVIDKSAPPPRLGLSIEGEGCISSDAPNTAIWPSATAVLISSLEDDRTWRIPVLYNPPEAADVIIEQTPYAGAIQRPTWTGTETADVLWFTSDAPEVDPTPKKKKKPTPPVTVDVLDSAEFIHKGDFFTPTQDEVGKRLLVAIVPIDGERVGLPVVAATSGVVGAFKKHPEGHKKYPKTKDTAATTRVLTYNILYEGATVIYKTGESMYPYTDPEVLELNFRKQLLMTEVQGFRGDVVAMQEVASSLHEKYLVPTMECLKYTGVHYSKTGEMREGLSTFWNNDRYEKIASHELRLGGEGIFDDLEKIAGLENLLQYCAEPENEKVKMVLEKTTTVGLVVVLEDKINGGKVVVGNTHLWFHPKGGHIRVVQLHVLFTFMKNLGVADAKYIVCGDLNCQPKSSPHVYMTTGVLEGTHPVWSAAPLMDFGRWDFDGEIVSAEESSEGLPPSTGPTLTHPLSLSDASPTLPHTNFTPGFTGRLDYILHSPSLTPISTHPIPPNEILGVETGIPSSYFPSDHLPVCVDFA